MTDVPPTVDRPRRRWLSFSLRTLAVLLTAMCLFLGWIGPKWIEAQREERIVEQLRAAGIWISYDYQQEWTNGDPDPIPYGPFVLRYLFGEHTFSRVDTLIVQPGEPCDPVMPLLPEFSELRQIVFRTNVQLSDESVQALAECHKLKEIRLLAGGMTAPQLAILSTNSSIEEMMLADGSASDACLAELRRFPNLKKVWIDSNQTTDVGFHALAEVTSLESFIPRTIPKVTDDGFKPLHNLKHLKQLETHNLFSGTNRLTEACLPEICEITSLEDLYLSFYDTRIDFDPMHYADFPEMVHLKMLSLNDSNIRDEALRHIAKMPQLEELRLTSTDITDQGLAHLKDLPNLRNLNISFTNITHEGLRILSEFPQLELVHIDKDQDKMKETLRSMGFRQRNDLFLEPWQTTRELSPSTLKAAK